LSIPSGVSCGKGLSIFAFAIDVHHKIPQNILARHPDWFSHRELPDCAEAPKSSLAKRPQAWADFGGRLGDNIKKPGRNFVRNSMPVRSGLPARVLSLMSNILFIVSSIYAEREHQISTVDDIFSPVIVASLQ
jgi:hypothetical protein